MAQSKRGIHNSMLLECVKFVAESITLRNVEGERGGCDDPRILVGEPAECARVYD